MAKDNPLEAAILKSKIARGHLTVAEEKTGEPEKTEDLQHYKVRCTHCNELMDLTDNDLLSYRTDDESSETGESDDDEDQDDDDGDLTEEEREECAKDRRSA